jgi:hypothetical protein
VPITSWFLTPHERGNPSTRLDTRHPGGSAWTEGKSASPADSWFDVLRGAAPRVSQRRDGDLLMFVDWRGDSDEALTDSADSEAGKVFADAAMRGLVWRSHWDRFAFSAAQNHQLGDEINDAGGQCLLDMRVRGGGSHHQKFVVLRHGDRPELEVAFLRWDRPVSRPPRRRLAWGDPQPQPMAAVHGPRPPWHGVQLAIAGPAVGDVASVFRERWENYRLAAAARCAGLLTASGHDNPPTTPPPAQHPNLEPAGPHPVQLLRTHRDA